MRLAPAICATALALVLCGCGTLRNAPMLAPGWFGMQQASPDLYVEPDMPTAQREALVQAIAQGRAQVEAAFGAVTTAPYIVACITDACARRFGSLGARAAAFGERAIRLAPHGLQAALVAHEWAHAELYRRVGGWVTARQVPRWFDEGLAVVIADEARHSADNWRAIQNQGLAVPELAELISFSQWTEALQRYGETQGDVPGNLRVVYTRAGHELRQWLARAGGYAGMRALLDAVRAGEPFDAAFQRLGGATQP